YEVNLKVDPEHLLDWDRQFQHQTPHVQEALRRADPEALWEPRWPGESAYDLLGSQGLHEAGVPGIQYLDERSRAAGLGGLFQTPEGKWFVRGSSTAYPSREAAQAALDA